MQCEKTIIVNKRNIEKTIIDNTVIVDFSYVDKYRFLFRLFLIFEKTKNKGTISASVIISYIIFNH